MILTVLFFASNVYAFDLNPDETSKKTSETSETNKTSAGESSTTKNKKEADLRSLGEKKGEKSGAIDGQQAAIKDYYSGNDSESEERLPKRRQIIKTYDLMRQSSEFRSQFLRAYRKAFILSYEKNFSELALDTVTRDKELVWKNGQTLGISEGAAHAYYDILNNRGKDWKRSYNEFIAEKSLQERYDLSRFNRENRLIFENSFQAHFEINYMKQFEEFLEQELIKGLNIHTVSYFEDTTIYDSLYGNVNKSDLVIDSSPTASLTFEQGTVYQNSMVGFTRHENLLANFDPYLTAASGVYEVFVRDENNYVKLYKPVKLGFVYGGQPTLGIYKWDTKRWLYQPTNFAEDGTIDTLIPVGEYSGGKYAVFMDENFKLPLDVYYNWAYPEILVSLKRQFIMQDDYFRPNDAITRQELGNLLYRTLYFRREPFRYNGLVVDRTEQYLNQNMLDFVLGSGIMKLDANYKFNPNQKVTYAEFSQIMDRAEEARLPFDFKVIADQMYYEDLHLSEYNNGVNNYITRAEVVYTLNKVFD